MDAAREINNGQPSALASWIAALDLKSRDRVYHMGCGVGYYTAIMAEALGPGGSVVAIDAQPGLAARAQENLSGYRQVVVHSGDGAAFDPEPCDAMLINAGVKHPHALWLERLREGGRLVLPLTIASTPTLGHGSMLKIVRESTGLSASTLTFVAILNAASLRDPQMEGALAADAGEGPGHGRNVQAEVAALRRAPAGRVLRAAPPSHVPQQRRADRASVGKGLATRGSRDLDRAC